MIKKTFITLILSVLSLSSYIFAQGCSFNGLSLSNNQIVTGYAYNNIDYGLSYNCQSRLTGYEVIKCQNGNLVGLSGGYYGNYPYNSCINNAPKNCVFGARFGQQITIPHLNQALYTTGITSINEISETPFLNSYVFKGYKNDSVNASAECDVPFLTLSGGTLNYDTGANTTLMYCDNGQTKDFFLSSVYCIFYYGFGGVGSCFVPANNTFNNIDPGYKYNTCQNRAARDCQLGNTVIKNGDSITTFDRADSRIGSICNNETRTCTDGSLSGSFTYLSCRAYNGICGTSNEASFTDQPSTNLCAAGTTSPITYNNATKKRNRSCIGDGGGDESCSAYRTGKISIGVCNDFPNGAAFLSSTDGGLCTIGIANNFQSSNFGWTRRCTTSQGSSYTCEAKKAIFPTARIAYSTTSPTNNSVTAYVLDIQPYGTFIQNNNSSSSKTFQTNGSYTFILKFDDKISYLTATIDWINTRPITLADLVHDYQSRKCKLYKNIMVEKSDNYNLLDMQTMANTCLLPMTNKGSTLSINPRKVITRRQLIEYSYNFATTIRNYTNVPSSRSSIYTYSKLPKSNSFENIVGWFGTIGGRKTINHKESKNHRLSVDRNKPATPKEVYETIAYILATHDDTISHRQALRQEDDRSKKKSVSYADYAYLMRRLLEGYDRIPIGVNDSVIYSVYEKISNQSIEDQKKTISELALSLKKISPDKAEDQGLSIRRMLDDMSAVYNNTIPKRKGVTSISLQQVQQLAEKQTEPNKLFYRLDQTNKSDFLQMSY